MLKLDKQRRRVKQCPCGKSNKDGKFVPYIGYDDKGYCHACGETFKVKSEELKVKSEYLRAKSHFKGKSEELKGKSEELHPMNTLHSSLLPLNSLSTLNSSLLPLNSLSTHTLSLLPLNPLPPSYISGGVFVDSLTGYENNHFVKYLNTIFGKSITNELAAKYYIGTSRHWKGANVFWQIDVAGKIRTGKIMLYNPLTGKRVKEPTAYFNWVHALLKLPDFNLQQCLFGEHLLSMYPHMPVALVESEKTAIIASVYMPQLIWLATGGVSNFNNYKCRVLAGRTVILYPDLSKQGHAFDTWRQKAAGAFDVSGISDLLEHNATDTDRQQGLDLADYLLRFNYRDFIKDIPVKVVEPLFFTWKQLYQL